MSSITSQLWGMLKQGCSSVTSGIQACSPSNLPNKASEKLKDAVAEAMKGPSPSKIEEHIDFFYELTQGRHFHTADGRTSNLGKKSALLNDFIDRIQAIEKDSENLFGLAFSDTTTASLAPHKKPFQDLTTKLQEEVARAQQNPSQDLQLSEETVNAAYDLISKLRELEHKKSSAASQTHLTFVSAPEVGDVILHLVEVNKNLAEQNIEQLRSELTLCQKKLQVLLDRQKTIFILKKLHPQHAQELSTLQEKLLAYSSIPDSLKYTRLLEPSEVTLLAQIHKVTSLLQEYVVQKTGLMPKLLEQMKEFITNHLPIFGAPSAITYSSFDKLHDAIHYFKDTNTNVLPEKKRAILRQLLDLCEADFKNDFLTRMAANDLADNMDVSLGAFKAALQGVATRNGIEIGTLPTKELLDKVRNLSPVKPHQPSQASSNYLQDFAHAALTYLKDSSDTVATNIGKYCVQLLKSDYVTKWIDNQSEEKCKEALLGLKNGTIKALQEAKTNKDCMAALQQLKEGLNSKHWILGLFELPSVLQDSQVKEEQTKASEALAKEMSALRKSLDQAKANQDVSFPWDNEAKASARIDQQMKELSSNLQDQFTYQLLYEMLLGYGSNDQSVFYNIKKLQANENKEAARKQIFVRELKLAINNAKASWLTKTVAKCLLWLGVYNFIGFRVQAILENLHTTLNEQSTTMDKQALLTRASHCFSKYNALLKNWAFLPNGGDKIPSVNRMMRSQEYLEYNQQSYNQSELYQKTSEALVNKFVHLDYTKESWLDVKIGQLGNVVSHRPFYANNALSAVTNWLWMGVKALVIGLPGYALLGCGKLIGTPSYWIADVCIRFIARKVVTRNKYLETIVQSTRQNVYEDSPYVHVITSFFADQFERLSTVLEQGPPDTSTPVASDSTRQGIKAALQHLFEILDKNRFSTQEQLKAHLNNNGIINRSVSWLDDQLLDPTIEALINLTVTVSEEMLTKSALRQPLSLLLDQLNEILTTPPNQIMTETEKLKQKAAEEKMHKYANKVLKQLIDQAVDLSLNDFGRAELVHAKKTLQESKEKAGSLLSSWTETLTNISRPNDSHQDRYKELTTLIEKSDTFLATMQENYDLFRNKESKTSKETAAKLFPLITAFKAFIGDAHSGLLALHSNYRNLHAETEDLPYISTCIRSYTTIQEGLEALAPQDTTIDPLTHRMHDEKLRNMVFSNAQLFHQTLSDFASGRLSLLKGLDSYNDLFETLRKNNQVLLGEHSSEMQYLQTILVPNFVAIDNVGRSANFFTTLKKVKNDQLRNAGGAWRVARLIGVDADTKRWKQLYQTIKENIQKISPSSDARQDLLQALQNVEKATEGDLDRQIIAFETLWKALVVAEKGKLHQSAQKLKTIHAPILADLSKLEQEFKADITSKTEQNVNLHTSLTTLHTNLATIIGPKRPNPDDPNKPDVQFDDIESFTLDIGLMKTLKKGPTELAYRRLTPKMDGIVNLTREGGFAQFLANHLLFMPLAEQ